MILCDVRMMYTNFAFLRQLLNCLLFSSAFDLPLFITGVDKSNLKSDRNLRIKFGNSFNSLNIFSVVGKGPYHQILYAILYAWFISSAMELSNVSYRQSSHLRSIGLLKIFYGTFLVSASPDKIESPSIRVAPFFHLPSSRASRSLVSSSNLSDS